MATVELNDAELALIEAERKRKVAQEEEAAAKLLVLDAKAIETMNKEITTFLAEKTISNQRMENFYRELRDCDGRWAIEREKLIKTFTASHGYPVRTVATKPIEYDNVKVSFKYSAATVVKLEVEYTCNEFDEYRTSHSSITPYGKSFKTARKLNAKVVDYFNDIEQSKRQAETVASLQDEVVKLLTTKFPGAKITKTYDFVPDYSSRYNRRQGKYERSVERKLVSVQLQNDVTITYAFQKAADEDVKLKVLHLNYSSVEFTTEMLLDIVKDLPKKIV